MMIITVATWFKLKGCCPRPLLLILIYYRISILIYYNLLFHQGEQDGPESGTGDIGSAGNNNNNPSNSSQENDSENCEEQCEEQECQPIKKYLRTVTENVQVQCCRQQLNQSVCTVSCNEGFIGNDTTYLCSGPSDCVPEGGQEIMCKRGLLNHKH